VISPSQRPLPDNTQHSQQTNIHTPSGIRTHDRRRRAAVDLSLRPHGCWDRHIIIYYCCEIDMGSMAAHKVAECLGIAVGCCIHSYSAKFVILRQRYVSSRDGRLSSWGSVGQPGVGSSTGDLERWLQGVVEVGRFSLWKLCEGNLEGGLRCRVPWKIGRKGSGDGHLFP
jgi:hypothetical protein